MSVSYLLCSVVYVYYILIAHFLLLTALLITYRCLTGSAINICALAEFFPHILQ